MSHIPQHPVFRRREFFQAGSIGLMGLTMGDVDLLRAASPGQQQPAVKNVIYIFLSGGLGQQDSFDMKPDAPDNIRGEFQPIHTKTPGVQICEHLPQLAKISHKWSLVRSLSHGTNGHSAGHHMMLTGRSDLPRGFSGSKPSATDHPSITAVAQNILRRRNGLMPPAAVLPFNFVHASGRIIPGQFGGVMGEQNNPWVVQASHNCPSFGSCPDCFDHQRRPRKHLGDPVFQAPNLRLPEGMSQERLANRKALLNTIGKQQLNLANHESILGFNRYRQSVISLLTSGKVRRAFDLTKEDPKVLDRYGQHLFGWSCLMARRLVEVGVSMIQVNLGRNETWDTHGNAFPHLKHHLFPPMDQCVSALIEDLDQRGMLESTMIVMAGEFGRTPKVFTLPRFYELPGRDHWGAVQSVLFAGGGIQGGRVVGKTDRIGGYPVADKQTPESMAATIYKTLGIPQTASWYDATNRPFHVYHAEPINGLT